jgi:hypothetical protein
MNDRDYPIPSYAVYVWIVGDKLHVCFPPAIGTKSHTVIFPATDKGVSLFLAVMRERRGQLTTIGQAGEPTGYQVERALAGDKKYNEWLRAMNVSDEREKELEALLEEVGL